MDTPDLNQLTNLTATQKAGTQNLLTGQSVQDADYLKRYTDFINGQEGASAMAGRIGSELGIPTLQANATMLRNTLTNLPSTYSKAMTGFDVNQNQLARVIGQKSSELQPAVTTAENSLNAANTNLNTRMGYETADQARQEKPYTLEQTMLATRQAREQTLFSEQNTNELNSLIAKINAGVSLSNAEADRANQLALQEKDFENQKTMNLQNLNSRAPVSTSSGDWIIDPTTGQYVPVYA